jgi:peptide/nickel transport system substrate-binding protein
MRLVRIKRLAIGVACIVAAALAHAGPAAAARSTPILRIGWVQDPSTLNPYTAIDIYSFPVWALNWDLPIGFSAKDDTPSASAGLADAWNVSPDRRTVTYKLRSGLLWSDGQPVTAGDVKFTLDTLAKTGFNFAIYGTNITSVQTPDPLTVVVHTSVPDVRMTDDLPVPILPAHIWSRVPSNQLNGTYQPTLPLVGTGPFVVTRYSRGHIVQLVRNPHYRGLKPAFSAVQFIKYGTDDAVAQALRSGEVDLATGLAPTTFRSLQGVSGITAHSGLYSQFTMLAFNLCPKSICPKSTANPALADVKVRQALSNAIDRTRINEIAARGTSTAAAGGILPPFYRTWYSTPSVTYSYDPARAKQILAADGWRPGSDGILRKGSLTLRFRLYARTFNTYDREAAQLIAEEAKAVGIEFDVRLMSDAQMFNLVYLKQGKNLTPDFDTYIADWQGDAYDPSFLLSLPTSQQIGVSSDSYYSNPQYDTLFAAQLSEFDPARRRAIIAQMVDITQRDLPYLVITYDPTLEAYRTSAVKRLVGSYPQPGGGLVSIYGSAALAAAAPGSAASGGGGPSLALWIAIGVVAVLLAGAGVVTGRRRSRVAETLET